MCLPLLPPQHSHSKLLRSQTLCSQTLLTIPHRFDTLSRMAKPALGRGLGALLGGSPIAKAPAPLSIPATIPDISDVPDTRPRVQHIALEKIRPCSLQPRKDFSAE